MRIGSPVHKTAVLAIVRVSYRMIVLDISIIITALPKIHGGLRFSATSLSWVQNRCTLAFGGLLLLGARADDIVARGRVFVVGVAVVAINQPLPTAVAAVPAGFTTALSPTSGSHR